MKKTLLIIITALFFLTPLSSQSESDFSFFIEPKIGFTFGKIGEYLHTGMSEKSRVISYLEWEEKPLTVLQLNVGTSFSNFVISAFVNYALPFGCGQMTDSDWYTAEVKNNYGIFDNKLSKNIDLGVSVDYNFDLPKGFSIKPIASLEYKYISFIANNGEGWYGSNKYSKTGYHVSWDSEDATYHKLSGIDYYQKSFYVFTGLGLDYKYNAYSFKLNLLVSPYSMFQYVDYHEDYKNNGNDYSTISFQYAIFKMFSFELSGECYLSPKTSLLMKISGRWMPEIKGETAGCYGNYVTKQNTDDIILAVPQYSGTSISEINIAFGCRILF